MIVVELTQSKVTGRKVVYADPRGQDAPIPSLYISKEYLSRTADGSWPQVITVAIEVPS